MPFPLIVGNVYSVNERAAPLTDAWVPIQNVVYEMSPLEFGSYDPELAAFINTSNLGTQYNSGSVVGQCVNNFDNAGWLFGWSSLVFHAYNVTDSVAWTATGISPINVLWTTINATFGDVQPQQQLDIAALPNPFQGIQQGERGVVEGVLAYAHPVSCLQAPLRTPARHNCAVSTEVTMAKSTLSDLSSSWVARLI